jgi:hypothetical protein
MALSNRILGGVIHCAAVLFAGPDAAVSFDADPKEAVSARRTASDRDA